TALRPIVKPLSDLGINVITQEDSFGLGEAATYVTSKQINCLADSGDIIIDVGYGASGLDILDIITDIDKEKNLEIYLVVNTSKFETCSEENILEYITFSEGLEKRQWKKFSGFISNTHFGSETTKEDIIRGYEILKNVSEQVHIPIKAIGAANFTEEEFEQLVYDGIPIWFYERMMPNALW
ncbi:MAG: hypothetical protein LUG16_05695, partial [Candidatus Gastranaerophilales bacterium]|nr:hypothetical protein [Candidatus Gastranaerophilales bacterium]